ATVQKLYTRKALLRSFHRLVLRAMATCAIAFGIMLLVAFGFGLIAGISRIWLLAWAATAFFWVGATRVAWRVSLRRRLRRGFCLERTLVLARRPPRPTGSPAPWCGKAAAASASPRRRRCRGCRPGRHSTGSRRPPAAAPWTAS